jgi:SAM-dependent methyltransferase
MIVRARGGGMIAREGTRVDAVRASYDAVAENYAAEIGGELAHKPIDRALLAVLVELVGDGVLADVGCGPGHVAAHLAAIGARVVGIDLSPRMVAVARARWPELTFAVGDMRSLPTGDASWGGAVCAYSIIHLDRDDRPRAYAELARAITPGGFLLVSFHTANLDSGAAAGQSVHVGQWWDHEVDLDFHFLDPDGTTADLATAGFQVIARTDREPIPGAEAPTRRSYLLARRGEPGHPPLP